jgi:hypothetical protein
VHHPCHAFTNLEARLGNSNPIYFHVKQVARSWRVPHVISSSHRFWGATNKPSLTWFWGTNQEIVAVILMPKSLNRSYQFWDKNRKTLHHRFYDQIRKNRLSGFDAKLLTHCPSHFKAKPLTNRPSGFESKPLTTRRPWFWDSTKKNTLLISMCMIQTAHDVTRPPDRPTTEYPICATIPGHLHQVSYFYHDPRRCLPSRTCHLHTTRQANAILHTK